jgi:phytoene dehydrogenase-like protein
MRAHESADAVVIGAGPNGLVAANVLVDAGWDVVVLEANDVVGGAVRSAEVTAPGFSSDLFSSFYPLAAGSPLIRDLDLGDHGLVWSHAPAVLAHALPDGRSAVLSRTPEETAARLEQDAAGDGDAWFDMFADWQRVRDPLLDALFTPFPPVTSGVRLLRRLGAAGTLDFARLAVMPVRRLGEENFRGDGARLLMTGNAMHADIAPISAGSGLLGWLLTMLGQDVGYPVPQGGAQALADALARRIGAGGGVVRTGARVTGIEVGEGRAVGVRLADGTTLGARRAVLADVAAPVLYGDLIDDAHLPRGVASRLERFQWDDGTLKINWALSEPMGWKAEGAVGAGTVHLGVDLDGFVDFAADLTVGRMPSSPFLLLGQMTTADATRSPAGTESVWTYTHVPRALAHDADAIDAHVRLVEDVVEQHAPGFQSSVLGRYVQTPADLEGADANLSSGAINAGTSAIHQQLVFRPFPGLGRPETPIPGLYLAGASAHPGGGVHGACGWNAARAALGGNRVVRRRLLRTAWSRVLPRD